MKLFICEKNIFAKIKQIFFTYPMVFISYMASLSLLLGGFIIACLWFFGIMPMWIASQLAICLPYNYAWKMFCFVFMGILWFAGNGFLLKNLSN